MAHSLGKPSTENLQLPKRRYVCEVLRKVRSSHKGCPNEMSWYRCRTPNRMLRGYSSGGR